MKRLLALTLCLLLVLAALPGIAEEGAKRATMDKLNALVKEYLESQKYQFDFEDDVFHLDFTLDSTLKTCSMSIFIYYDMVSVSVWPDIRVAKDNLDKMAVFMTLANNENYYSQFRMNYETGDFSCRSYQLVEKTLPGLEEIDVLVTMALTDLDDFGDALAKVALLGAEPQQAFKEIVAQIDQKYAD